MSFYVVLCPEETSWSMSPEAFGAMLKGRWPDATIKPSKAPGTAFSWSVPIAGMALHGSFDEDGLTVGLDGPFCEEFVIFACWYRTIVPPEVPLILADESYETTYPLTAETTPDDIISGRIATEPPDEIP